MSGGERDSDWIVEPPAFDEALISIDTSTSNTLTDELRGSLEALARALEEVPRGTELAEVEAFTLSAGMKCPTLTVCSPETSMPCAFRLVIDCTIKSCPSACPKATLGGGYSA